MMNARSILHSWYALVLCTAFLGGVGGCAQMGLASPQTFEQKTLVAEASVTEVRRVATTLLNAKAITAADGTNVLATTDTAISGIAVARQMAETNPAGAITKLDAVTLVLKTLNDYLISKGTKP